LMDKHEKLDETLEKMREESAAASAATPPPDWGRLEQNVILRLVRQVKARRVVIIALSTILLCGLTLVAYGKLFYPSHLLEGRVSWDVGNTEVEVEYPQKKEDSRWVARYYLYDTRLEPIFSRGFTLTLLRSTTYGSHAFFTVRDNSNQECYIIPDAKFPVNRASRNADYTKGISARSIEDFRALAAEMLETKVWPVPLRKIAPAIRQLHEGKYIVITSGPMAGQTEASKLNVGNQNIHTFLCFGDADGSARGYFSLWPEHFAAGAIPSMEFVLSGGNAQYQAYQEFSAWGHASDEQTVRIKKALWLGKYFLPMSTTEVSADLNDQLTKTVNTLWAAGPESLQAASRNNLLMMLKPWYWDSPEPNNVVKPGEKSASRSKVIPCNIGGVGISKPMGYRLKLEQNNIALWIKDAYGGEGTPVQVNLNEDIKLRFYLRESKPFPRLATVESENTEKLLATVSDMAKAVLAQPSSAWPEGKIPDPNLKTWLTAIVARELVLEAEYHRVRTYSEITWEGDGAALAISFGETNKPDIEVRFEPDKFTLHLVSSNVLLTSENGKAELLQAPGGRREALSAREMERLKACINALDALRAYEPIRVSPEANVLPEGKLAQGVPSSVLSGIDELRRFLANPVLPDTKQVSELPKIEWGYEDLKKRW
jgi:hypothetical protein